jgi:two-component system cell cycle response regulator CpdR
MIVARTDPGPPSQAATRLTSKRILIADDDTPFRDVVRDVLEEHGAVVLTATSALEALQICQSHTARFDLVIADVVMPLMDGVALASRLRGKTSARILLVSGQLTPSNPSDPAWPADMTFLQKPFTRAELLTTVCELLQVPMTPRVRLL